MKKFAANENENIRSFRKCFENTALNNSPHAVWCDFIKLSAISISAAFDIGTEKGKKRAEEFEHT